METEVIIAVKKIQKHCYDKKQCEPAYYAKSDKRPGFRWYVGYGSEYRPAGKTDFPNIHPYGFIVEPTKDCGFIGVTVRMHRTTPVVPRT
jgi:hypothetical protein